MKKNIFLSLIISIFFTPLIASIQFTQPSEERILEKSFKLQKEEKTNLHIKWGVRAALYSALTYTLYNGFIAPKEVKFVGTPVVRVSVLEGKMAQLEEKVGVHRGIMGWLEDKIMSTLPGLAVQIAFIMGVQYTMEKMHHKPHTVHSYMSTNTRLQANISALAEHCKELEKSGVHNSVKLVAIAYNNVLEDLENIMSFVECRARGMNDQESKIAYYFARTMFKTTEKLCVDLQEQLAGEKQLTKTVAAFSQTIMSLIATYYASFHHLEITA